MSRSRRQIGSVSVSVLQATFLPLLFVVGVSVNSGVLCAQKFTGSKSLLVTNSSQSENFTEDQQEDFLHRLLHEVLGIEHAAYRNTTIRHHTHPPPQYMLDLYKAVASTGGLTLTPNPYYANVVRSYLDRDASHNMRFFFNVSSSVRFKKDRILEAEFHLYKLKPRLRAKAKIQQLKSQLLEVRLYQVMHKGKNNRKQKESGHKLLDSRRVSVHSTGWEIFYVKEAVMDWIKDNATNMGLLVTVQTLEGDIAPDGVVRFAKRYHHIVNRHPLLVLFVDDGRHSNKKYHHSLTSADYHTYGYENWPKANETRKKSHIRAEKKMYKAKRPQRRQQQQQSAPPPLANRTQRAISHVIKEEKQSHQPQSCTRHDLYVDFEKIGWSAWIISPKGYNAHYCKGHCAFPLGQNQWPTNHATVQSIVYELKLTPGVGTPCCVPNKLYPISLLYFDEHENVILKQYDDMVASSCGCH